jgi:hypothetical protein
MIDRIEVSIIEENQPRWLAFLGDELDLLEQVPGGLHDHRAAERPAGAEPGPAGHLPGPLPARGRLDVVLRDGEPGRRRLLGPRRWRCAAPSRSPSTSRRRSASSAAARRSPAVARGSGTTGYDPAFRSEMSEFSRARAQALLDVHGYVDRDGDGWRELPAARPLVLEYATQPDEFSRQLITQWKKNMDAIGVRIVFAMPSGRRT